MIRIDRFALLIALCWAILTLSPIALAQTQSATLAFGTEGLKLASGTIVNSEDLEADSDFHIAYNADRSLHSVLMQNAGVEVAFLADRPFESVSASDLAGIAFTTQIIDQPLGFGDTVLLRLADSSVFKIGNATEDASTGQVHFVYEQIQ